MGGRVSYNRKNKGKPSYQPMLTFIAETREYAGGGLHNGDKPTGESIARHLARVIETLPKTVETLRARADAGFYCWEAVKAYTEWNCEFVIVARATERLLGELQAADWRSSPHTDADFECQFSNQPEGWDREYRFVGLRYDQPEPDADNPLGCEPSKETWMGSCRRGAVHKVLCAKRCVHQLRFRERRAQRADAGGQQWGKGE